MGLLRRIKNIIKSNINYQKDIGFNHNENLYENADTYDDIYYDDSEIPTENKKEREYYAILELEYGAGFDKIKSAYRKLLKKYHPDMFQNKPEKLKSAQKLTKKINEAYNYFERKYR